MNRLNIDDYKKEYIGKKYNRLTITDVYWARGKDNYNRKWCHCICDCGNETDIPLYRATQGIIRSCGCLQKISSKLNGLKASKALLDTHRKFNDFYFERPGTVAVIPLGQNINNDVFYVDAYTWEWFKKVPWYIDNVGYMTTCIRSINVRYHSLLLSFPSNYVTDHIDRNKCNNMYSNLRAIPQSCNMKNVQLQNSSGYKNIRQVGPSLWSVTMTIPKELGIAQKYKTKRCHTLQEAIVIQKEWEDEIFKKLTFNAPHLFLPDGSINPYFRFDWFHPRYNEVWKGLGIIK